MSSVPNLLARIQCLEAYTTELEEGQRQIFRFLGRWVDEADQSVSLLLVVFFGERLFHWDKHVFLKVELVRYEVWQLRRSSGWRLNASMSHSGRAHQSPYGRWDGARFPFVVSHMFWSYQSCEYSWDRMMYELIALRYSRQQTFVWTDSITLSATAPSQKSYVWFFFARLCTKKLCMAMFR